MFTEGKPEGKGEKPQDTQSSGVHLSAAASAVNLLILQHDFLVFILLCCILAVCSLCKHNPPSPHAQQTGRRRSGETIDCSCRHTGPSLPKNDKTRYNKFSLCTLKLQLYRHISIYISWRMQQTNETHLITLWLSAPRCSTQRVVLF